MKASTITADDGLAMEANTRRWIGELPIYAIALGVMSLCVGLLMSHGIYPTIGGTVTNTQLFLLFAIIVVISDMTWQLYKHRPVSPIDHLKARYSQKPLWRTIIGGLPLLAIAIIALPFFSKMKSAIPLFNEYTWDSTFIAWDRAIFFGYDAWEVFQPVLGYPVITAFLALLYHLWFLLLYPGVMFFVFFRVSSNLRRRFFLTYALSWAMIGGFLATMLASVGPCFVGPMFGDTTFDAQMAYLNAANEQIPVMTLRVQGMLLEWYANAQDGLGSGITAMPSMHCAIAFLYWLAMRHVSPLWGRVFGVFFAIIWVGSVHLAYHYAVDGIVSVIAVAAIWKGSQALFAAWDAFLARSQPTLRTNTVPAE